MARLGTRKGAAPLRRGAAPSGLRALPVTPEIVKPRALEALLSAASRAYSQTYDVSWPQTDQPPWPTVAAMRLTCVRTTHSEWCLTCRRWRGSGAQTYADTVVPRLCRAPSRAKGISRAGAPRRVPPRYRRSMQEAEPTEHASVWNILGERLVDDTRRLRLSIADVELPDGVRFEQYVLRIPKAAMVVVVDDAKRVLMMRRHRFIVDRWVWELPGGYVDPDEDPAAAATREVEEETGWRPQSIEPLASFQPMIGSADAENLLFWSDGAELSDSQPDINEAESIEWLPLSSVETKIASGEIIGAASIIGLLAVMRRLSA